MHIPTIPQSEVAATVARIAREKLCIACLDTRNSDRLDFHDVAVWSAEAALTAAFAAGVEAACLQLARLNRLQYQD